MGPQTSSDIGDTEQKQEIAHFLNMQPLSRKTWPKSQNTLSMIFQLILSLSLLLIH